MPFDLIVHGTTQKYILRESMRSFVPARIYRREKHPFDSPPVCVYGDPDCREKMRDMINSAAFRAQPFFETNRVLRCLTELETADAATKQFWDPVLMTVLSTVAMQSLLDSC